MFFFLLKVFLFSLLVVYAFSCMGIIIIIITCLVHTAVQCMDAIREYVGIHLVRHLLICIRKEGTK